MGAAEGALANSCTNPIPIGSGQLYFRLRQ